MLDVTPLEVRLLTFVIEVLVGSAFSLHTSSCAFFLKAESFKDRSTSLGVGAYWPLLASEGNCNFSVMSETTVSISSRTSSMLAYEFDENRVRMECRSTLSSAFWRFASGSLEGELFGRDRSNSEGVVKLSELLQL